ncbi:MAG: M24 family metallopeptidase, partial [Nevskiales bacterium]
MTTGWIPTSDDLSHFREVQRLAYQCAETTAAELKPGTSERETAARMKSWLLEQGVDDWFHQPFAWFGDRTA